jgi:hypothetical protein
VTGDRPILSSLAPVLGSRLGSIESLSLAFEVVDEALDVGVPVGVPITVLDRIHSEETAK